LQPERRQNRALPAALEPIYVDRYGSSPFGWSDNVVLMRVDPEAMYAYAPQAEWFPEGTMLPSARARIRTRWGGRHGG
jgi:hypothetical protein